MAGRGVGGAHDGAHGVSVDHNPVTDPGFMEDGRTTPCSFACHDPAGCAGHPALVDGDCEEVVGPADSTPAVPSTFPTTGMYTARRTDSTNTGERHSSFRGRHSSLKADSTSTYPITGMYTARRERHSYNGRREAAKADRRIRFQVCKFFPMNNR